jgi:hypothetical protein
LIGLSHVVVQGNVETIALAGEFGAQQAVNRFFAERAVNLGLFRHGRGVFDRRGTVRRNGAKAWQPLRKTKARSNAEDLFI